MNIKGCWMSVYLHLIIVFFAWAFLRLAILADAPIENAWSLMRFLMVLTYGVMLGGIFWGMKRLHWVGPRMQQIQEATLAGIIMGSMICFLGALYLAEADRLPTAGVLVAIPALLSAWVLSGAYEGASKPDWRKIKPIVFSPSMTPIISKLLITCTVFPILVRVIHFLFSLPFVMAVSLFQNHLTDTRLVVYTIHSISLIAAIVGAFQVCKKIWPKEDGAGRA